MYDTVKGSDWLGDQDAIEYMCRNAILSVIELENYGVPFSRTEGKIYQRPLGGHTPITESRWPAAPARRRPDRPCHPSHAVPAVPEASGAFPHRILCPRPSLNEDDEQRRVTGQHGRRHAAMVWGQQTVLATGGYGRVYFPALAHTCTGDGNAMVLAPGCRFRTWSRAVDPTVSMAPAS